MESIETNTIICSCGTHLLNVIKCVEHRDEVEDPLPLTIETVYLSIYSFGNIVPKIGIWKRFILSLRILFKGEIYADQIVLGKEETNKLIDALK
jgi:hypothetical protein